MQIVIDIPEEQIKKSLEESKYIHEDEGEHGFVNIEMLYTNARLEFVDIERKTDFYSCEYKILPKGHGRIIDESKITQIKWETIEEEFESRLQGTIKHRYPFFKGSDAPTIIEADKEESEDKV